MTIQTISAIINGQQYDLHVEQETYNGWPAYYIIDDNLSALFKGYVPDNLILFETNAGVEYCPRVTTLEGREIAQEIWKAIKGQVADTPQPFGPGLG